MKRSASKSAIVKFQEFRDEGKKCPTKARESEAPDLHQQQRAWNTGEQHFQGSIRKRLPLGNPGPRGAHESSVKAGRQTQRDTEGLLSRLCFLSE